MTVIDRPQPAARAMAYNEALRNDILAMLTDEAQRVTQSGTYELCEKLWGAVQRMDSKFDELMATNIELMHHGVNRQELIEELREQVRRLQNYNAELYDIKYGTLEPSRTPPEAASSAIVHDSLVSTHAQPVDPPCVAQDGTVLESTTTETTPCAKGNK